MAIGSLSKIFIRPESKPGSENDRKVFELIRMIENVMPK